MNPPSPVSSPPPASLSASLFYLKAFDPADLERRLIDCARFLKTNPFRKIWVVIPHLSHSTHWKNILSSASIPLLNFHFITPSQLRERLAPPLNLDHPLPLNREGMRFILEKTCESLTELSPLFQPLSRDARPLLRTLDEIENSGLSIEQLIEIPELTPWFKKWATIDLGKWGRANQDRAILHAAKSITSRLPEDCLWLGLNRDALAFAPLLQATSLLFERVVALQLLPEVAEESPQQLWLQKIEEWLPHAEERLPSESPLDLDPPISPSTSFFCAPSLRREADLILSIIQKNLNSLPSDRKIGVVIPSASPIGSWLALELEKSEIPFYSTLGESSTPEPADLALLSLIKIQIDEIESPDFIDFLETHREQLPLWNQLEATSSQIPELRDHLYRSFQKTLSTRLDDAKPHPLISRFRSFYQQALLYPETLTLSEGLHLTANQIHKLCGIENSEPLLDYLKKSLLDLDFVWKKPLTKKEYLTLLQRLIQTPEQKPLGSPQSPLWLIRPDEAVPLQWHTLLIAQLNESFWPSLRETGLSLLNDEIRTEINQRFQTNPSFQPMTTLSLRYQSERARFETLLSSAQADLYFTASGTSELQSGDELYPSEFYRQAWNRFRPHEPWQESFWNELLQKAPPLSTPHAPREIIDTMRPTKKRLDPEIPFDEFLFCDTSKAIPHRPLSATHAEAILKDPAAAWFEIYLQTKPLPDSWQSRDLLGLAQGNRLHQWIADSFRALSLDQEFTPLHSLKEWQESLHKTISLARQNHLHSPHIPLWWKHHFPSLEWRAEKLLENLYQTLVQIPDPHIACEYRLQRPMIQPLPEFPLEQEWIGRIDWIALNDTSWDKAKKISILDLKTGNGSSPFNKTTLLKSADYFQLLLYAGLAQAQHPGHPEISVGVILPKWAPPVEMTTLSAFDPEFTPLWKTLADAWLRGTFGQRHEIHQRFSIGKSLPLATTPIPQEILDAKLDRFFHPS